MTRVISIHSFRGGTGKSNTTANIAALLAMDGQRVAVIDTDIQSPGVHVLFGIAGETITTSLNSFLNDESTVRSAAHDVTDKLGVEASGKVFLVPSSINPGEIARVLREGYDVTAFTNGMRELIQALKLDVMLIDTHPGLHEETLLSLAISHALLLVLRPDSQDYEGTGVTVEVARQLRVPSIMLMVNKTPESFGLDAVRARVEEAYGCPVIGVLPHADEMMTLASGGIFVAHYPDHAITHAYREMVASLLA